MPLKLVVVHFCMVFSFEFSFPKIIKKFVYIFARLKLGTEKSAEFSTWLSFVYIFVINGYFLFEIAIISPFFITLENFEERRERKSKLSRDF